MLGDPENYKWKKEQKPPEAPTVLADRYLLNEWQKHHKGTTPPTDLRRAVIDVVMAVGYKKEIVDNLLTAYYAKERAQATASSTARETTPEESETNP